MKIRQIIVIMVAFAALTACVKEPKETRFSMLGESFSAYEGFVDPDSNDVYPYDEIGLTGAEQMWWSQVADSTGWVMDINNSFSGALVCNFDDFSSGNYYAPNSYLRRMDNLGSPDVIFVFWRH